MTAAIEEILTSLGFNVSDYTELSKIDLTQHQLLRLIATRAGAGGGGGPSEYQEIEATGAGSTTITPSTAGLQNFRINFPAEEFVYTIVLETEGAQAGEEVHGLVTWAIGSAVTFEVYSGDTSGEPIYAFTADVAAAEAELSFVFDGTEWIRNGRNVTDITPEFLDDQWTMEDASLASGFPTAPRRVIYSRSGSVFHLATWAQTPSSPDVVITARVRFSGLDPVTNQDQIVFRAHGAGADGYGFDAGAGGVALFSYTSNTPTVIGAAAGTSGGALLSGVWYQIEYRIEGDAHSAKVMRESDGLFLQPGATVDWDTEIECCSGTNDDYPLAGDVGVDFYMAEVGQSTMDAFTVTEL